MQGRTGRNNRSRAPTGTFLPKEESQRGQPHGRHRQPQYNYSNDPPVSTTSLAMAESRAILGQPTPYVRAAPLQTDSAQAQPNATTTRSEISIPADFFEKMVPLMLAGMGRGDAAPKLPSIPIGEVINTPAPSKLHPTADTEGPATLDDILDVMCEISDALGELKQLGNQISGAILQTNMLLMSQNTNLPVMEKTSSVAEPVVSWQDQGPLVVEERPDIIIDPSKAANLENFASKISHVLDGDDGEGQSGLKVGVKGN